MRAYEVNIHKMNGNAYVMLLGKIEKISEKNC